MLYTLILPSSGDSTVKRMLPRCTSNRRPCRLEEMWRARTVAPGRGRTTAPAYRARVQAAAPFIVAIQHRPGRRRRAGAGEQQLLGGEIVFHRVMKIQMVASEVGKNGGMEVKSVDAAERQRVGRHFHGGVRTAAVLELREQAVPDRAIPAWY